METQRWHITHEWTMEIQIDPEDDSALTEFGDKLARRIGDFTQSLGYDMELNATVYGGMWGWYQT